MSKCYLIKLYNIYIYTGIVCKKNFSDLLHFCINIESKFKMDEAAGPGSKYFHFKS